MKTTSLLISLFAMALACGSAIADNKSFPGVETLMSPEEYKAAGLEKLTPTEREALNRWLIRYTVGEAPVLRGTNEEVKVADDAFEVTACVKPPFKGWSGDTVFYLDNGQVWRQRIAGRYQYSGDDCRVVISKNFMGLHNMKLINANRTIGVTRVR